MLQNLKILDALGQEVVAASDELAVNGHKADVHDDIFVDLLNGDVLLAARGDGEVAGLHHLVPLGHVLLQNAHVLDALGQEVVAAGNEGAVSQHEADLHDDILVDLLNRDVLLATLGDKEVAGLHHLIALGQVLLQNTHVLDALGQEVVAASDKLAVNGHEADVHDHVLGLGSGANLNQHTASDLHIASPNNLIPLGDVGQSGGVHIGGVRSNSDSLASHILAFLGNIVGDGNVLCLIFGRQSHGHSSGSNLLDVDFQLASVLSEEIAAHGHLVAFRHILRQNAVVLSTSGHRVVATGNHLVAILKLDVHDDVGVGLYLPELYQSPILNLHITQSGQFITLGDVGQSSGIDAVGIPIHNNRSVANNTLSFLIPVVDSDGLTVLFCGRSGKRRHRQQCQHHAQGQQC